MAHKIALWMNGSSTNLRGRILHDLQRRYTGDNTSVYRAGDSYKPLLDADVVAIFGGDGTAMHVLNGLIKARGNQKGDFPQILVLPYGNGNALGYSLGTQHRKEAPSILERTIEKDLTQTVSIPLIEIKVPLQDSLYFTFASVGLDAQVVNEYETIWRPRCGKMGYIPAGLRHLAALTPLYGKVENSQGYSFDQDGVLNTTLHPLDNLIASQTVTFGVGTTPHYGWGLKALPFAEQARGYGLMHARSFNPLGRVAHFLAHIHSFWSGQYRGPLVNDAITAELTLRATQEKMMPLEVAGDVIGYVPSVTFRVAPQYTFRFITATRPTQS
ncbi:hypothetical protein HYV86_07360 [Candidatus Woesearchaeota archaeon]|nr:hypothetical protein [Candidatus Woesearchaeota archaeon]